MKTLLLTLEYPPQVGGVASYYYNLVQHWPDDLGIIVLDNSSRKLEATSGICRWHRAFKSLIITLRQSRPEQIIVGQLLPLGLVVFCLSFFFNFKYSICLHGMDFTFALRKTRKAWISRLILRRANNIICANSYLANLVKNWQPKLAGKISIVNPGAEIGQKDFSKEDIETWHAYQGVTGKFVLLGLGRLVRRKGFDTVIAALRSLPEHQRQEIALLIVGDGPELSKLKSAAAGLPEVKFLGALKGDDKLLALKAADAFIMTPRDIDGDFEGFGIVYLEAALAGKPSIGSHSGGISDAIIDKETGLLVAPDDIKATAEAIIKFKEDSALRQRLGEAARQRAEKDFNWSKQAQNFYEALKR